MNRLVLAAAFVLLAMPVLAQECTEADAEARSEQLFKAVEENGTQPDKLDQYIAEVESEYGGEPPVAQTCEAIDKLIVKVLAGE